MANSLSPGVASSNVFHVIYIRSRAALNICLHLLIYNYAMLAIITSLPPFLIPHIPDFSIEAPHIISIIFPITAAFIAYVSASSVFAHVNIYVEKQLIPTPSVSKRTRDAYPLLSAIIMFVVAKEVIENLGLRDAWIWIISLAACCLVEAVFLFLLVFVCSILFPKFGEGTGPLVEDFVDIDNDVA